MVKKALSQSNFKILKSAISRQKLKVKLLMVSLRVLKYPWIQFHERVQQSNESNENKSAEYLGKLSK